MTPVTFDATIEDTVLINITGRNFGPLDTSFGTIVQLLVNYSAVDGVAVRSCLYPQWVSHQSMFCRVRRSRTRVWWLCCLCGDVSALLGSPVSCIP